jgi:hypothetical protein
MPSVMAKTSPCFFGFIKLSDKNKHIIPFFFFRFFLQASAVDRYRYQNRSFNSSFSTLIYFSRAGERTREPVCFSFILSSFTAELQCLPALKRIGKWHNDIHQIDNQHNDTRLIDAQHRDPKHNDVQYNDAQHYDVLHNGAQHTDTEHN